MFEYMKTYRTVLVTGPHRSGTTICARMIAADTGKRFVMEREIATPRFDGDDMPSLDFATVRDWIERNPDVVLQGATCWRWLCALQRPSLATVYVDRDHVDVARSQKAYRGRAIDNPADKRAWWMTASRDEVRHPFTVRYKTLARHPLFVADRAGWEPRQIAPTETPSP